MDDARKSSWVKPLAESGGAIRRIFLYDFLHGDNDAKSVLSRFSGIFASFPPTVTYVIMVAFDPNTHTADDLGRLMLSLKEIISKMQVKAILVDHLDLLEQIRQNLDQLFSQSSGTSPHLQASLFAQDPFASLVGVEDHAVLLSPLLRGGSFEYYFVAEQVSSVSPAMVISTLVEFTGGNILNGEGFIIVGKDVIAQNLGRNGWKNAGDISSYLAKEFGGVQVLVSGTDHPIPTNPPFNQGLYQPIFHVDLYITIGGVWEEKGLKQQLVFVGELQEVNAGGLDPTMIQTMKNALDQAATEISGATLGGLPAKVVRTPLVLTANAGLGTWITFNNSVSERRKGKKIMYLPQYKDAAFQAAAKQAEAIYTQYGFEVVWVKGEFDFYALSMGGSLHCIVKVTNRENS